MNGPVTMSRDEWIRFFEAIPEDQWLANGQFKDYSGRYCARGHINRHFDASSLGFMRLMSVLVTPEQQAHHDDVVAAINDGKDPRYPQPTPRSRILAALHDLPQ